MVGSRYQLYQAIRRVLPSSVLGYLTRLPITKPLRDWLFRPAGATEIVSGRIEWEDQQFLFSAPYQVFYRARRNGIENRICRLARSVLKPGDTGIDVGANYGFVTIAMMAGVWPSGLVVAFEIDPTTREVLKRNVCDNNHSNSAVVVPKGAGAFESENLTTVDTIVARRKLQSVTFLKIDVDGTELSVLEGALDTLRTFRPVVVVELNRDFDRIFDLLVNSGYSDFFDLANHAVQPGIWPTNLIASTEPVPVPPKGTTSS